MTQEKAIIYNRTSTKEQSPELQLKKCQEFADEKGLEVIEVIYEKASAYKQKNIKFEEVREKAIKNQAHIILFRYDRAFRNRKNFYDFMREMFYKHNLKVYSATETSIMKLWNLIDEVKADDETRYGKLLSNIIKDLWDFLIDQKGEEAEEDSKKKGESVKSAIKIKNGVRYGKNNNKWGRKKLYSNRVINKVLELRKQGYSIRNICKNVQYTDKNNNMKNLSLGGVHKILSNNPNLKE